MPPKEMNKWTSEVDRDLLLAMLAAQNAITPQWRAVNQIMASLGHTFTDSAVSQRWSKTIFKKFKDEHHIDDLGQLGTGTPAPARRRRGALAASAASPSMLFSSPGGGFAADGTPLPGSPPTPAPKRRGRPPKKVASSPLVATQSISSQIAALDDDGPARKKAKNNDNNQDEEQMAVKPEVMDDIEAFNLMAQFTNATPIGEQPVAVAGPAETPAKRGRKSKAPAGIVMPPPAAGMQDVIPKAEEFHAQVEMTQMGGQMEYDQQTTLAMTMAAETDPSSQLMDEAFQYNPYVGGQFPVMPNDPSDLSGPSPDGSVPAVPGGFEGSEDQAQTKQEQDDRQMFF